MANRLRGEVEFTVGEKTYTFRLGMNELVALEQTLGIKDPIKALAEQQLGIGDLRALARAGLSRYHKELTDEEVGDLIDEMGGLVALSKVAAKSFEFMGGEDESSKPEAAGTGPVSSPLVSVQG